MSHTDAYITKVNPSSCVLLLRTLYLFFFPREEVRHTKQEQRAVTPSSAIFVMQKI